MDKKSIIGIALIFLILVVFSYINQPSKEEIEAAKHRRDSIEQVEAQRALEQQKFLAEQAASQQVAMGGDSIIQKQKIDEFGIFGTQAIGEEEFSTLENDRMKITFSNKGGRIYSVELKDYQTYDSLPLMLFDGDDNLLTQPNRFFHPWLKSSPSSGYFQRL